MMTMPAWPNAENVPFMLLSETTTFPAAMIARSGRAWMSVPPACVAYDARSMRPATLPLRGSMISTSSPTAVGAGDAAPFLS